MAVTAFFDLGTTCGYAVGEPGFIQSGEWQLKTSRFDSPGMRGINLRRNILALHAAHQFTHVGFEQVRRHMGVDAAHSYGGQMMVLQIVCHELGIDFESVPVGTLKKFWTTKGNASKDEMIQAARDRGFEPASDNEADAIAGWHWLQAKFEPLVPAVPALEGGSYEAAE